MDQRSAQGFSDRASKPWKMKNDALWRQIWDSGCMTFDSPTILACSVLEQHAGKCTQHQYKLVEVTQCRVDHSTCHKLNSHLQLRTQCVWWVEMKLLWPWPYTTTKLEAWPTSGCSLDTWYAACTISSDSPHVNIVLNMYTVNPHNLTAPCMKVDSFAAGIFSDFSYKCRNSNRK